MTEPRECPFVDPLHGEEVVFIVGPDVRTTGVAHPDCGQLAPVAYGLDSAYCAACRWQCRISGAWALDMIEGRVMAHPSFGQSGGNPT